MSKTYHDNVRYRKHTINMSVDWGADILTAEKFVFMKFGNLSFTPGSLRNNKHIC